MAFLDKFFKSAFTVDNVIFGFDEGDMKVLLIKRGEEPFNDYMALPGYFIYENENIEGAAYRVLNELTGITDVYLEQVGTFGDVGRHPLGRVITVAYYSLIKINAFDKPLRAGSMAKDAEWFSLSNLPELAFDHRKILDTCFQTLRNRVRHKPVGFELLPPEFTLTELQHLYEIILGTPLDKRNFRKKILSMNLLNDLNKLQEGVAHRPAKLYAFDKARYKEFIAEGYIFDISESRGKAMKSKS